MLTINETKSKIRKKITCNLKDIFFVINVNVLIDIKGGKDVWNIRKSQLLLNFLRQ